MLKKIKKNKTIFILAVSLLLIILAVFLIFKFFIAKERVIYEVAVMVNDQWQADEEKNIRDSLKAGDVLVVMPEGHNWSDTEKRSYLILKMLLTEDQKNNLLIRNIKEYSKKDIKKAIAEKGNISETEKEQLENDMKKNGILEGQRLYRIDFEKISFDKFSFYDDPSIFKDQIFDWSIVEKKRK